MLVVSFRIMRQPLSKRGSACRFAGFNRPSPVQNRKFGLEKSKTCL